MAWPLFKGALFEISVPWQPKLQTVLDKGISNRDLSKKLVSP